MLQEELLLLRKHFELDNERFNKRAVEELAKRYDVHIVRLPPYHCHLSPIELYWAHLKFLLRDVLAKGATVADVEAACCLHFEDAGRHLADDFKHCISEEDKHAAQEGLDTIDFVAPTIAPVIVQCANDEDDEDEDGEDEFVGDEFEPDDED
jgi:hypothetical protein